MFNRYFLIFLLLLIAEITIAILHFHPVIRGFVGDLLVIPLLYSFIRIFYFNASERIVTYILLFAFAVELAQYFHLADVLQIESKIIRTVMGSSFDWTDFVAYIIGGSIIIAFKRFFQLKNLDRNQ